MNSVDIARRAAELVGGDRARQHGDKVQNHAIIAAMWNGLLEARRLAGRPSKLDALDVANLMEALKIARRYSGAHNDDDYIDGAGYAAVAGEIAARQREMARVNQTWADAAIEGCPAGPVPGQP